MLLTQRIFLALLMMSCLECESLTYHELFGVVVPSLPEQFFHANPLKNSNQKTLSQSAMTAECPCYDLAVLFKVFSDTWFPAHVAIGLHANFHLRVVQWVLNPCVAHCSETRDSNQHNKSIPYQRSCPHKSFEKVRVRLQWTLSGWKSSVQWGFWLLRVWSLVSSGMDKKTAHSTMDA